MCSCTVRLSDAYWLHCLVLSMWHHRLLFLLLVYAEDLQFSEGGLNVVLFVKISFP